MIRSILLASAVLAITASPAGAATATSTHAAARVASAAKPRDKSGMVTTRLANGRKVTYDCHLAGNKTKAACKGVS